MGSYCSALTMLGAPVVSRLLGQYSFQLIFFLFQTFPLLVSNLVILLPCQGRLLNTSEERSDYYYEDIEDHNEYYNYDENDTEEEVDYASIHAKVPFHKSQISYKEAIYLPSLYKPAGKEDKPTLQRNRLRDVFVAIRRQCGGGQRDFQQGLCQYFFGR